MGGAERVALAISRILDLDEISTSMYDPMKTYSEFSEHRVRVSGQRRPVLSRYDARAAVLSMTRMVESIELPEHDVVVCSSSGWAHGVRTKKPKIVYFHTPARWLYEPDQYFSGILRPVRPWFSLYARKLERWDRSCVQQSQTLLANSTEVKHRIGRVYGRTSDVVHPPCAFGVRSPMSAVTGLPERFLLTIARGRGYKNTTAAVQTSKALNVPLVVIGGEVADEPPYVIGLGRVKDEELAWLYANALALVAFAHEDFGLTPIEANMFGTPVVALGQGGYLDTVVPGVTGVLAKSLELRDLVSATESVLRTSWDKNAIVSHAQKFSLDAFGKRLSEEIERAVASCG
ncbi:glycosyltransferase [Gordonia mangrovi]|nr:glycosyltransferase [Gordonia mangrovi]UVF80608.1 glycosyltransferase [Gordonia mangrovi]